MTPRNSLASLSSVNTGIHFPEYRLKDVFLLNAFEFYRHQGLLTELHYQLDQLNK